MDGRAPLPLNSSLSSTCFTQKAPQAGILKPEDLDSSTGGKLRDAIRLEIQKEDVRQKLIAAEIARRLAEAAEIGRSNYQNNLQFTPLRNGAVSSEGLAPMIEIRRRWRRTSPAVVARKKRRGLYFFSSFSTFFPLFLQFGLLTVGRASISDLSLIFPTKCRR